MAETPDQPSPRRRRSARREQGPAVPGPVDDISPPTPAGDPTEDRTPPSRKRARRRTPTASPMPVDPPLEVPAAPAAAAGGSRDRRTDHTERALRGLVTTRGTQVPWSAATRAREVAMPSAADLAAAAAEVVIVRRNYTPPEPLRATRTGDGPRPRRRPG